ncbi:unnamed protein product [Clonostachys byssicola]|uniref:Aminotransferase class I/classII large domain-containing protein n=1 Tax=Clonostachys byssicola TaxID=160290 RepID=A0A9N9TZW0_9HYPO|nr:unnamed protein product [Clonostachys byssicola]
MAPAALEDFETQRLHGEELSTAPVAYTPSAAFKSKQQQGKPDAVSLSHHFSNESRDFEGSPLKKTALNRTDFVPLGTGRPTAELYPWSLDDKQAQATATALSAKGYNLTTALNYGHAGGTPFLIRYLTEHVELVHNPPYRNWETCLTAGSTSAMEIALRIFGDRGDVVLTEEFTYPGFLEAVHLSGMKAKGVKMDDGGLREDSLAEILDNWNTSDGPKPKLLYTIPTGQNPTGYTQSLERRKAIYRIADRHDLIVIEDDPYYYIKAGPLAESDASAQTDGGGFISQLIPSYLSLDTSGRVIRLDSTAKILAPGLRAGWVTASERVISKFMAYHEVTTVAVSGMSQLMLYDLLDRTWGHEGFFRWLEKLSGRYRKRRDIIVGACQKYLPRAACDFIPPSYGMFVWIRFDMALHPQLRELLGSPDVQMLRTTVATVEQRILQDALQNGVQVTKGSLFRSSGGEAHEMFFRLTFAAAREDELAEGVRLFAEVVRKEFLADAVGL